MLLDGDGIPDAQELLAPSTHSAHSASLRAPASAQGTRGPDPHDPASVLRLSQLDKTVTGMQMQWSPLRHRRLAKPRLPTLTGKTYRLEYTDNLSSNQWHPLTAPIPGDGKPVQVVDPAAAVRPQRFYRLIVVP